MSVASTTIAPLLAYLTSHGIVTRNASTGCIESPLGVMMFVRERTRKDGKVEIVVDHPPKGGRCSTYTQRFTSRERALAAIRTAR